MQRNPLKFIFLGMTVERDESSISVSLPFMEDEFVAALGAEDEAPTPYASSTKLRDAPPPAGDRSKFRGLVAMALYFTTHARTDLSFIVGHLTTRQMDPDAQDWEDLRQIARVLRHKPHVGRRFVASDMQLRMSADGGHLSHSNNSRGRTGLLAWVGAVNAPIYASSTTQEINVSGAMKTEILALHFGVKLIPRLTENLEDAGYPQHGPVPIEQDNNSLLIAFDNEFYSGSTKHVNARFNLVISPSLKVRRIPRTPCSSVKFGDRDGAQILGFTRSRGVC